MKSIFTRSTCNLIYIEYLGSYLISTWLPSTFSAFFIPSFLLLLQRISKFLSLQATKEWFTQNHFYTFRSWKYIKYLQKAHKPINGTL